jgi:hypothetical protein
LWKQASKPSIASSEAAVSGSERSTKQAPDEAAAFHS